MHKSFQVGTVYINKYQRMCKLVRLETCNSTINDIQCNACNHEILHLENHGQVCPIDAYGKLLWHPIIKTNIRW